MDSNGNYQVTGLRKREQWRLNAYNQPATTVIYSFMIGPHGPFEIVYALGQDTPAQVTTDITAKVNQLRETDALLAALNQGTK